MLLAAVVGLAAAAIAAPVRSTYGARLSADEPHYLMTAMAIAERGSLDVAPIHAEERYRRFHEVRLPAQAAVSPDGRMVVPHDPLLPALLALPWRIGGWMAARLTLAAVNGVLAALLVWTTVRRLEVPLATAVPVVAVAVASVPLAAYGAQLYPELPAALATVVAVAAGLGRPRAGPAVAAVAGVVALPWLAVKYVPVAGALALAIGWRWWRAGGRRVVLGGAGALVVAAILYVAAHLAWYGGVTAYAAGAFFQEQGSELTVVGTDPNYLGRARRLWGLLVDAGFGLAAWQPLWLLAVPAIAALLRRRPDGFLVLLLPAAAGWLTATFVALTMHGWWFPGRQTVVILPLLVLAITMLCHGARRRVVAAVAAGLAGVVSWVWLVVEGRLGRLTMIVDFGATTAPLRSAARLLLPDHLATAGAIGVRDALWLGLLLAAAAWGWRHGEAGHATEPAGARAPMRGTGTRKGGGQP